MANKSLRSNTRIRLNRKRQGDHVYDVQVTEIHPMKTRSKIGPIMDLEEVYCGPSPKRLKKMQCEKEDDMGKFPIFTSSPPKSPKIQASHNGTFSPGSPSKRQVAMLKEGSKQSNKIFKYLQFSRPLEESTNAVTPNSSCEQLNKTVGQASDSRDKENTPVSLKVDIVIPARDEGNMSNENQCCTEGKVISAADRILNWESCVSEHVVQALDSIINSCVNNPAQRLGVAQPVCTSALGACKNLHGKAKALQCTVAKENLYQTMVNSNLQVMMLRQCLKLLTPQCYLSPTLVHTIFSIIKKSADKRIVDLGKSCLHRLVHLHPPCVPRMRMFYLSILHSPDYEVKSDNQLWALMECKFFEEILLEIEKQMDKMLSPAQLKKKREIPVQRNIVKPRRFCTTPSPKKRIRRKELLSRTQAEPCTVSHDEANTDTRVMEEMENMSQQAQEERLRAEAALKALSDEELIDNMFARLNPLAEVLERDLLAWLVKHRGQLFKIRDRTMCPLVVMALWKPGLDTGFDSVNCRRVFSLYASAWVLNLHPMHLKTLSRLIGLIAEVISASEPNPRNVYPNHGIRVDTMGRKVADVLRTDDLGERAHEAVAMLKPAWLRMYVSSSLLKLPPTIESMDPKCWSSLSSKCQLPIYSAFLEAALDTYHVKEALYLLHLASEGDKIEKSAEVCSVEPSQITIDYKVIFNQIMAFYKLQKFFEKEEKFDVNQMKVIQHLL